MHFGTKIGLIILLSGVLSAPLDNPDKKISDPASSPIVPVTSGDSSVIKKDQTTLSVEMKNEKLDSALMKDEKGSTLEQLNGESPKVAKNGDIKAEMKDEAPASEKDDNKIVEVSKFDQNQRQSEASPDVAVHFEEIQIKNEVVDKKEKEMVKEDAGEITHKDGKQSLSHLLPPQKPAVSHVIGNFIYEMLQAPIYLLRAFKDLIGNMLGIKPAVTSTTVPASGPY